jgi:hypothetical protein
LSLAVVVAYPLYAFVGFRRFAWPGVAAASVAAAVCWLGATLALVVASHYQKRAPLTGLLLGMLFRMGFPLVAGLTLQETVPALAEAGIFGFVLAFYFLTLVVETLLSVRMVGPRTQAPKAS